MGFYLLIERSDHQKQLWIILKMSDKKKISDSEDEIRDENIDFEAAMAELEQLVKQMENGDLSLDASLKAFERGVLLTRRCQTSLAAAELKVKTLSAEGNLEDLDLSNIDG
jgi:exodeoxyribonuclease VII small subunit